VRSTVTNGGKLEAASALDPPLRGPGDAGASRASWSVSAISPSSPTPARRQPRTVVAMTCGLLGSAS
jgi:hypothetical protein